MNADRCEIRKATDRMNELLYREELMWMQRSRITWLKDGDRNANFFHAKSVWRARKNRIKKIEDLNGTVHTVKQTMEHAATSYFQDIFSAKSNLDASPIIDLITPVIDAETNARLCTVFSEKEISDALFQIGPLKALGPDGFPARFFQRNWDILRDGVITAVKIFFRTGIMPPEVNDTVIVLIPKIPNPVKITDFRPISLCNVIYKVVSKCMVNHLRPVPDDIISPT